MRLQNRTSTVIECRDTCAIAGTRARISAVGTSGHRSAVTVGIRFAATAVASAVTLRRWIARPLASDAACVIRARDDTAITHALIRGARARVIARFTGGSGRTGAVGISNSATTVTDVLRVIIRLETACPPGRDSLHALPVVSRIQNVGTDYLMFRASAKGTRIVASRYIGIALTIHVNDSATAVAKVITVAGPITGPSV